MQKKIIALAVAGLVSGAAFAQSNVTVYGIVDAAYVHASGDVGTDDRTFNGVVAGGLSGSRLGFKGTEDLGGGLKAVFVLEYGLGNDVNAGVGTALARQQYVGLSNSMGTLTLGRQYAPGFGITVANDAFAGAVVSPMAILQGAGGNTIAPNSNARWNNSAAYVSPSFGGLTVQAIYGFGQTNETNTDTSDRDARLGLSATYANGPVRADVIYQDSANNAAQGNKDTTEWYLGGSYNFGVAKLIGSYQNKNDKSVADMDNKIWQIGVAAPVTAAGTVHASYGRLDNKNASNNDANSWAVGYTHGLSKRTTLYTTYTRVSNDRAIVTAAGPIIAGADESNSTIAAGIRHAF